MIARMIQWRYLLPRLIVASIVSLVVWLGLEPALKAFMVGVGERIMLAKVDIEKVDASLTKCDLSVHGVQIAHPNHPHLNLIECDTASFDVATSSILQRRLLVRDAHLSGVRFNTPRGKSGEVELPPLVTGHLPDEFDTKLAKLGGRALREFAAVVEQDLRDDLVSIQLCQELGARWPADLEKMVAQADSLRKQIDDFRKSIDPSVKNVAGMAESFPDKIAEVERLRRETNKLRFELGDIAEQMARDRDAIAIARKHDEEVIKRKLKLRDLDPQAVSEYLLGEELSNQTCELVRWIKLARRYWPREVELPESERSNGEDITFPGLRPHPKALVEKLRMDGTFRRGDRDVAWRGEIFNLTTDPSVTGKPMVIRAQTQGSRALILEATLDRTGKEPRDRIVISFPQLMQPQRTLGRVDQLAVSVAPGQSQVWAELSLVGEELTGRVVVLQNDLHLTAQLPERFGTKITQRVATALDDVRSLQAEVRLTGTLDKPSWQLRSNLGPQVSTGLTTALRAELDERQVQLASMLDQFLLDQQAAFDKLVSAKQQEVLAKLDLNTHEVDDLKQVVAGRVRLPSLGLPNIGKLEDLKNPFMRR